MRFVTLSNIYRLGLKELQSLRADKVLLILICWAFSGAIYTAATGASQELRNAPIAVVDEDQSPLSRRIVGAFYPPYFRHRNRRRWPNWIKAWIPGATTSRWSSRPISSMTWRPAASRTSSSISTRRS